MTIATQAPAAASGSRPRPGFVNPAAARMAALAFLLDGWTATEVREGMHPDDGLLSELATAMDAIASTAGAAPVTDYWVTALGLLAAGTTSASLLAHAADGDEAARVAASRGLTLDEHRADLAALARNIKALEAEGITQEKAHALAGLDRPVAPVRALPAPRSAPAGTPALRSA